MLSLVFVLLSLPQAAHAAPQIFTGQTSFAADASIKDRGAGPVRLDSGYLDLSLEQKVVTKEGTSFFMANIMPVQFDIRVRFRRLPAGKGGKSVELVFERFDIVSAKQGGSATRKDSFGQYLKDKPLVVPFNAAGEEKLDGLTDYLVGVSKAITDTEAKGILDVAFSKNTISNCLQFITPEQGCLGGYAGKTPAASWKATTRQAGVKLKMDCAFQGWAKAGEKKVAIVSGGWPNQVAMVTLATGQGKVATNTKGESRVYFEPATREAFASTTVTATALSPIPNVPELRRTSSSTAHVYAE